MKQFVPSYMLMILLVLFSCSSENEEATNAPAPVINVYSPKKGIENDVITISGQNFGATVSDNKVTFSGINAKIIEASTNQLKVEVPKGLNRGNNIIDLLVANKKIEVGNFKILVDDFKYLLLENSFTKKLYEIGNNTGLVTVYDEIKDLESTNVSSYGYDLVDDLIYMANFTSSYQNSLFVYNLKNKIRNQNALSLPIKKDCAITVLKWDSARKKLLAIATEDIYTVNVTKHYLFEIDPNDFSVKELRTSFNHSFISSTAIKNNSLYIFSSKPPYDLSEINLNTYEIKKISTGNADFALGRTAFISNTELVGFKFLNATNHNMVKLIKFNLVNSSVEILGTSNMAYISFGLGSGFYDLASKEFIDVFDNPSIKPNNTNSIHPIYNSIFKFKFDGSFSRDTLLLRPKMNITTSAILKTISL